jgi:hypothetical protein
MVADVHLHPRAQRSRDVLGERAIHDLLNGEVLPLGMFAMKESGCNPGLIRHQKADSRGGCQLVHNSNVQMIF